MVWKAQGAKSMQPFHLQKVQVLGDADYLLRIEFVRCMIDASQKDPPFPTTVLVSVESCFMREGVVNMHIAHMWSSENPRSTVPSKLQHMFGINICAGTI